jgi:hypothetical protein
VPEYLKAREGKLRDRSLVEVTRYLAGTKYRKTGNARTPAAFKALHKLPIDAITRDDVTVSVDDIARARGKTATDRARPALSGLLLGTAAPRWPDANPTINIDARVKNGSRKRTLSEAELIEVWRACLDNDYGRIVNLFIRRTSLARDQL